MEKILGDDAVVAERAHNSLVVGSNPTPHTIGSVKRTYSNFLIGNI